MLETMVYWYYDKDALKKTPSIQDGISYSSEGKYRKEGARFIIEVGTKLDLPNITLATGVVYFHRFYMFQSFKTFPRFVTACCCLFLAGKVEETPKKCKDIIRIAKTLLSEKTFITFGEDPRKEVMILEKILLQTIKFDLKVKHPYTYLIKYAKCLNGNKGKLQKMVQMAWTFINDSLSTTLSIQWEPEIVAIAVMYLAGKLSQFEVTNWAKRKSTHLEWWDLFVKDLKKTVIEDICHQILDIYEKQNNTKASISPVIVPANPMITTEKQLLPTTCNNSGGTNNSNLDTIMKSSEYLGSTINHTETKKFMRVKPIPTWDVLSPSTPMMLDKPAVFSPSYPIMNSVFPKSNFNYSKGFKKSIKIESDDNCNNNLSDRDWNINKTRNNNNVDIVDNSPSSTTRNQSMMNKIPNDFNQNYPVNRGFKKLNNDDSNNFRSILPTHRGFDADKSDRNFNKRKFPRYNLPFKVSKNNANLSNLNNAFNEDVNENLNEKNTYDANRNISTNNQNSNNVKSILPLHRGFGDSIDNDRDNFDRGFSNNRKSYQYRNNRRFNNYRYNHPKNNRNFGDNEDLPMKNRDPRRSKYQFK